MVNVKSLHPPKMWKSNVTLLLNESQKASVFVPDGCAVAVLVRGQKPITHSLDGQGEYEIDCPINLENWWPVAVCVIERSHMAAWGNLKSTEVERILDRCSRPVHAPSHTLNGGA